MNRAEFYEAAGAPLVRGLAYEDAARIFWIDNTVPMRELLERTRTKRPETANVLAESFSAASLLSGTLKDGQRLTFNINAPLLGLRVRADAEASGGVRAYVDESSVPDVSDPLAQRISEHSAFGAYGTIRGVRSSASGQFTGIADLPGRSIIRGIEHYFRQSEQNEICLRARIELRGGRCESSEAVFAQLLPNAPEGLLRQIAASLDRPGPRRDLEPVRSMRKLDELSVRWQCYCSREMLAGIADRLERSDGTDGSDGKGSAREAVCRICGRHYDL